MAGVNVTAQQKQDFINQSLEDFLNSCKEDFDKHKFDVALNGLTISNSVMNEFIDTRVKATQPGQKTSASNEDIFTMLNVLAKNNAVALTSLKRAEYHEKMSRTLTSKMNDFEARLKDVEGKDPTQSSADDIVKGLADLLKINGPKVQAGGHKPVSEHKAVQQLKSFTGDRSKFREWNETLLNALA